MDQYVKSEHVCDDDGNPAGGSCAGTGIAIEWQNGPMRVSNGEGQDDTVVGQNGAFVEGVINAAIQRIQFYQSSRFRCRENALALTKLEEAVHWLNSRTASREAAGVEGTHGKRLEEG